MTPSATARTRLSGFIGSKFEMGHLFSPVTSDLFGDAWNGSQKRKLWITAIKRPASPIPPFARASARTSTHATKISTKALTLITGPTTGRRLREWACR